MGRYSDSSDDAVGEYYQAQNWRKEGAKEERERIIKLLEDEIQRLIDIAGQREGGPAWRSAGIENCERTIALIKGETNE